MLETLLKLHYRYQLDIVTPFVIEIAGKRYSFECLVEGYGAPNGMVIDADWSKLTPVTPALSAMGFGFSCVDIKDADVNCFDEILDDWGLYNAEIIPGR